MRFRRKSAAANFHEIDLCGLGQDMIATVKRFKNDTDVEAREERYKIKKAVVSQTATVEDLPAGSKLATKEARCIEGRPAAGPGQYSITANGLLQALDGQHLQ
jgi:hypothetical protein